MTAHPTLDEALGAGLAARLARDLDGSFPELVEQYGRPLYAGALRFTASREDAEDLAQETFVRAYRALGGYDRARIAALDVRAWLWTILANLCRNHARRATRRPTTVLDHEPAGAPAEGAEVAARVDLTAALAALPAPQRLAVVLRHVGGLGSGEIAVALGRPEGTVKSDIHRGLATLRRSLTAEALR